MSEDSGNTGGRLKVIRGRLDAFKNSGVSWRIQVLNPYVSSSSLMQEAGSYSERVLSDLIGNIVGDLEYLLGELEVFEGGD